jgi:predicted nucleic acid-binding protein
MIIVDTNVISEITRERPAQQVTAWLDAQAPGNLFTTAISLMEVRFGLAIMPEGHRRQALTAAMDEIFTRLFAGRILPFDQQAAEPCARMRSARRAAGRPLHDFADAAIAAIALSHSATLATRNLTDFADLGLDLADPWAMPQAG